VSARRELRDVGDRLAAIRGIDTAPVRGRVVLLRVDLNVPMSGDRVLDETRVRRAAESAGSLLRRAAIVVVLGHREGGASVRPLAARLAAHLGAPVAFEPLLERAPEAVRRLRPGECLLLENVRAWPGEAADDPDFGAALAALGDLYVNDAIATCHRRHATIVGLPRLLPHYAGPGLLRELRVLTRLLHAPGRRVIAVGGTKASKLAHLPALAERFDRVLVGGGLADALEGIEGALSLDERPDDGAARALGARSVRLPVDRVVELGRDSGMRVVDIGPRTAALYDREARRSAAAVWCGPMGRYEAGHTAGSRNLAEGMLACGGPAVAAGGDTAACARILRVRSRFSHVSTAGGAALAVLAGCTLPGLSALAD
jgi:phosphoglycerate kinase